MEQCYVPCELVYPDKYVTNVSQSIVKGRTGTVNNVKESYLQPLVFYTRRPSIIEPSFSFVDCVIDPTHIKRKPFGCNLLEITEFDSFGFGKVPEFLPDFNSALPAGQFKLGYPQSVTFEYELLTNYTNPSVTYSPNPPKINVTATAFVSSYFNCFRFSSESMRIPIISATESYWTNTIVDTAIMNENTYLYHPEDDASTNLCYEAPLRIWLHWKACNFWNIPSRVRRVYGICEMILPLGLFNSSYAAIEFKGEPPLGCMQRSYPKFDVMWQGKAYGTKTVAEDMFPDLNYYCNSCAYSKENHYNNIQLIWCGFTHYGGPNSMWYSNYACFERNEFTYKYFHQTNRYTQVQVPITTAQKTMRMAKDFAYKISLPNHATSHFYEHGVFRNPEERPQLIYERGRVRPERIDVTDGGDGPRTMVAHHNADDIAVGHPLDTQYSNLCAAFDTPECLFVSIGFDAFGDDEKAFDREEERYFGKYLYFRMEETCSSRDKALIARLLDNDNKLPWMKTEPWELTDYEIRQVIYCCLPAEYYRLSKSPNYAEAFRIWQEHMHFSCKTSFGYCTNINDITGQPGFGFPISWNSHARYPRGVTAEYCSKNKCQYDPKKVVGADYCNRQFDPSESSIVVPECTMDYLNYG
ncbi:unnamed protein product [Orchesella dallaii]|uniref:Uncharacterized protein n=1 Tax=Orchesella dallaii TaxID=48710 RepID=A0ABP1RA19_9HEXA